MELTEHIGTANKHFDDTLTKTAVSTHIDDNSAHFDDTLTKTSVSTHINDNDKHLPISTTPGHLAHKELKGILDYPSLHPVANTGFNINAELTPYSLVHKEYVDTIVNNIQTQTNNASLSTLSIYINTNAYTSQVINSQHTFYKIVPAADLYLENLIAWFTNETAPDQKIEIYEQKDSTYEKIINIALSNNDNTALPITIGRKLYKNHTYFFTYDNNNSNRFANLTFSVKRL